MYGALFAHHSGYSRSAMEGQLCWGWSTIKGWSKRLRVACSSTRRKLARYKPYAQVDVLLVLPSFDTRAFADMDLYVDGNIAQMSGPQGAAQYFARLLGVDAR